MHDSSSPVSERFNVLQVFCGRYKAANILDHPGNVLRRMQDLEWVGWKDTLNLSHVYLLGLWDNRGPLIVNEERGVDLQNHANRCPSPFAISDHMLINPLLGTQEDFCDLVHAIHQQKIRVLVDFVPNHTGTVHEWVKNHPDYYKNLDETAFSGDVVELNYENPEVVREMTAVLMTIAGLGVDGVRCDMAHLVPIHFWKSAINTVKNTYPAFTFVAEAYSDSVFDLSPQESLYAAGFDSIYDEPLYRNIRDLNHAWIPSNVSGHLGFVCSSKHQSQWMHYISNHDDLAPFADEHVFVWQALLSILPGWNLLYNGSLWGYSGRLAHHWVEILPADKYSIESLGSNVKEWYAWLKHSLAVAIDVSSDGDVIIVRLKSKNRQGIGIFNIGYVEQRVQIDGAVEFSYKLTDDTLDSNGFVVSMLG